MQDCKWLANVSFFYFILHYPALSCFGSALRPIVSLLEALGLSFGGLEGFLGPHGGLLESSLGPLGDYLGRLESLLGPLGRHLEASWD